MNKNMVGVLGGGTWGSTISDILGENGNLVCLWLKDKIAENEINTCHTNKKYLKDYRISENIRATTNIKEVAENCTVLFLMTPSHSVRDVMQQIGNYIRGDHLIIHGVKGIEENSFLRISQIIKNETCCKRIGILSGPNLAMEVIQKQPAAAVLASRFPEVVSQGQELLMNYRFRVYGSKDITGVEVAGALKNIIALATGLINGLGYGDNTKALIITRGMVEIMHFGTKLGGNSETFSGLAGIGDLIATCASPLSRNHQVGFRLAQGQTLEQILKSMTTVAEGIKTVRAIANLSKSMGIELPITQGVYDIMYNNFPVNEVIDNLMIRKAKYE